MSGMENEIDTVFGNPKQWKKVTHDSFFAGKSEREKKKETLHFVRAIVTGGRVPFVAAFVWDCCIVRQMKEVSPCLRAVSDKNQEKAPLKLES